MDVRQMSAVNQWRGIRPGIRSLLGLYTRCVWISADEFKFQGQWQNGNKWTDLRPHWTQLREFCRWVKTHVIVCYQKHEIQLYLWTFNQWEKQCFARDC